MKPTFYFSFTALFILLACSNSNTNGKKNYSEVFDTDETGVLPLVEPNSWMQALYYNLYAYNIEQHPIIAIPTTTGFDYPFGPKTNYSQRNDGDGWYNRQDFRVNNHMGEDWNKEGGAA
ncbi:MAG: hypothetical protein RI894_2574, partial [Bacteroidota bacterium]